MSWVKLQPQVQRLWANHHPDNVASGKVMEKSGMTCKGIEQQSTELPQLGSGKFDMVVWEWIRDS
jgi:RimJ/RimL family protein N-acetyltransferase